MGLSVADYNNDGFFDIYVSNGQDGNVFLKNNGNGTFTDIAFSLDMSVNRICWGNNFFDYDNDGDLDLYISVSGGSPDRINVLFRNNGNNTFTKMTGIGLDNDDFQSYGNAIGDFNNDGYCDITVLNEGDPCTLWRNSGGTNKWIKIKLQGIYSNREGVGSVIEIFRGNTKFIRTVNCGQSYCSQNSLTPPIGVGNVSTIDSIKIKWPSGAQNTVSNVSVNQTITILENPPIGINPLGNSIPANYKLHQNYPNPFNPSTKIVFEVPRSSTVTMKLYNPLGQEIKTLVHGFYTAGVYELSLTSLELGNLASGIYYYKIITGDFSDTKKMIYIK